MLQVKAQLVKRKIHGAGQELRLFAPSLAQQLAPGQPVLVRTGWGLDPYLRRSFYPVAIDAESWTVRLPPSGDRGHAWLRMIPEGSELDCLGPVGIGYTLPEGCRHILCLGEGETAWTLLPLIAQADARHLAVTLVVGATSARYALPANRLPLTAEYRVVTVDGSRGRKGNLASHLSDLLAWADAIVVAGSLSFYHQLAGFVQEQRGMLAKGFVQALYPSTFLCGTGACLGCVADVAGGRRRVCLRGPVFDLVDLIR